MQFDMPTLWMMLLLSSATLTFSVGWVAYRNGGDGLGLWACGLALNTLAIILLGLRDRIPDLFSIVGGNAALAGAYSSFLGALLQLQRRRMSMLLLWGPPLAVALAFPLLLEHLGARIILSGVVCCFQLALLIGLLTARGAEKSERGRHLLIGAFSVTLIGMALRSFLVVSGRVVVVDITSAASVQVLLVIASFIATVLGSNGFVLMAKEYADQRFRLLAKRDPLTGAWSRAHLDDAARQEIERHQRYGHPVSLVMVDIDHFKQINDQFGHAMGDRVLQAFCRLMQDSIRASDVLGRWGGEEFVMILPNTDFASAKELAERGRALLAAQSFPEVGKVTASFGVTSLQSGESWERWLYRSDMLLYRAKAGGRNRVEALEAELPFVASQVEVAA
jgi:diguanylate cyclase (GGDEF)-like protein